MVVEEEGAEGEDVEEERVEVGVARLAGSG